MYSGILSGGVCLSVRACVGSNCPVNLRGSNPPAPRYLLRPGDGWGNARLRHHTRLRHLWLFSPLASLFVSVLLAWFQPGWKETFLQHTPPFSFLSISAELAAWVQANVFGLEERCVRWLPEGRLYRLFGTSCTVSLLCTRRDRRRPLPSPPPSRRHFVQLGTWRAFW